jgi:hypothetical protein
LNQRSGLFLCASLCACDLFAGNQSDKGTDQDGDGYTAQYDCDDINPDVHPGADEYCDDIDWDCDGEVVDDHALDAVSYFADLDFDGRGDPLAETRSCAILDGHVTDATDCDDTTPRVSPDVVEVCDGLDNDCDDEIDVNAADVSTWRLDADGDGYGTNDLAIQGITDCDGPTGYIDNSDDCDDNDPNVHPSATEEWYDGIDQNCAGDNDFDADGDGFVHADHGGADCMDHDATVHPDMDEVCDDGIDNDCDGTANTCGIYDDMELADAIGVITGENNRDQIGNAIANVGDITGDGLPDVLIDARYSDINGSNSGAVYLMTAPINEGEVGIEDAIAVFAGEDESDLLGTMSLGLGDLNGDGFGEFIISSISNDVGGVVAGSAYLFLGPTAGSFSVLDADAFVYGNESGMILGASMAAINGGEDDTDPALIIGMPGMTHTFGTEPTRTGGIAVFPREMNGELHLTDDVLHWVIGEDDGDGAGTVVATGDINGDGMVDIVASAPRATPDNAGRVYVLLGPGFAYFTFASASFRFDGASTNDGLGATIHASTDLTGDGYADLIIGAPGTDESRGTTYFVSGSASTSSQAIETASEMSYIGATEGDEIGAIVQPLGDVDADGETEIAFGVPNRSSGGGFVSNAGLIYLAPVSFTGTQRLEDAAKARVHGENTDDESGTSIAAIGDTDGDGFDDVLIGAPFQDSAGTNAGAVYLLKGGAL